jgi:pterin-4a-carbinolamine dehydratase
MTLTELAARDPDRAARETVVQPDSHAAELAALGTRWTIAGGDLQLWLPGPMTRTGAVAAQAGALADALDHHPRIVIEYPGLTLAIHTHDARAITLLDLIYAARLEVWLRQAGW